jgi:hypothetical protein
VYTSSGEYRKNLSDAHLDRGEKLVKERDAVDERIDEEQSKRGKQDRLAEARNGIGIGVGVTSHDGTNVSVTGEKMVYGGGADSSFYADGIVLSRGDVMAPNYRGAYERMMQWSNQVEHEVADDSAFGRVAERQLVEQLRTENTDLHRRSVEEVRSRGRVGGDLKDGTESRAIASGGGTTASAAGGGAAAFVTPVFGRPYIPYREYGRAFADQCFQAPLPDYGLAIYKPQVTGPAGMAQQTETSINSTGVDPTAGYATASLVIFAGEVTLSQVILDRMAPDYRFDVMCEDQLHRDYDPKFDSYVLTQALAGATSQSWTGNSNAFDLTVTSGSGGFYGQVSKAKGAMRKLAGTVLNPTHLFLDPARYEYIAAWSDANGRPMIVPDYAGPFNAAGNSGDGDAGVEGYSGTRFNGLPVFTDANLPTTTSVNYDQAIVGDLAEAKVYEGAAINRVLPQTYGNKLLVVLQRYSYATVLVNYAAAVTSINGSGFSAISYTS